MRHKKVWIQILIIGAIVIAGIAYVAAEYIKIAGGAGNSCPPSVAFLYAVPYLTGIVLCLAVGAIFHQNKN